MFRRQPSYTRKPQSIGCCTSPGSPVAPQAVVSARCHLPTAAAVTPTGRSLAIVGSLACRATSEGEINLPIPVRKAGLPVSIAARVGEQVGFTQALSKRTPCWARSSRTGVRTSEVCRP